MIKTTHSFNGKYATSEEAISALTKVLDELQAKKQAINSISMYKSGRYVDDKYVKGEYDYLISVKTGEVEFNADDIFA